MGCETATAGTERAVTPVSRFKMSESLSVYMSIAEVSESNATRMTDEQIREFLTARGVGVLALPDEEEAAPYAVPMSFGYDGDSALYFVFLLFGTESRKEALSDRTERARFVAYRAGSIDDWQSVTVVGRIGAVGDEGWDALRAAMENAWHPNLFSTATPMRGVEGYRLRVDEWIGIQRVE